jgi:hypothetical protein
MPSVAAWLLARPQNAVFAMAIAMLMPGLAIVSGAILLVVVLQQNLRRAATIAVLAASILLLAAFVVGSAPLQVLLQVATLWLPVLALAAVMRATRSLTLTLQLTVIFVVVGAGLFIVLIDDPVTYWQQAIAADPLLRSLESPLQEWKTVIGATDLQFAGFMTTMYAIGFWFGLVIIVLLGYWLYLQMPDNSPVFGRFRDLNFGRVIAFLLAVTSVAGFVSSAVWIQSVAFILFAAFWLQGAAIAHWLRNKGKLPVFGVAAVYALTVVLPQYAFSAVAVVGYTDAWFNFRNRVTKQQ